MALTAEIRQYRVATQDQVINRLNPHLSLSLMAGIVIIPLYKCK